MNRAFLILATAVALGGAAHAALAQAPKVSSAAATGRIAVPSIPAWRAPAPTATAPAPKASAQFGCNARAPDICHFRIFYTRGDRIVILPAGMKEMKVPVIIGGAYCMTLNKSPAYKCVRKVVNGKYNT